MENTVLVLGAGVSFEYGYPIGSRLVTELKDDLRNCSAEQKREFNPILNSLIAMNPYSIDFFLSKKPEYSAHIKKLLIHRFLAAETINPDFIKRTVNNEGSSQESDSIYKKIFNAVPYEHYDRLFVISFNYDRSFEAYFIKALTALYEIPVEEAYSRFNKIKVTHVYGRLPSLQSNIESQYGILISDPNHYWSCEYGGYGKSSHMHLSLEAYAVKNLFTVHEDENKKEEKFWKNINEINTAVTLAKRIFFLGFGYHELNMEVLGFKENKQFQEIFDSSYRTELKKKLIVGTSLGMGAVERKRVLGTYNSIARLYSCTNIALFDEHVSLTNCDWDVLG